MNGRSLYIDEDNIDGIWWNALRLDPFWIIGTYKNIGTSLWEGDGYINVYMRHQEDISCPSDSVDGFQYWEERSYDRYVTRMAHVSCVGTCTNVSFTLVKQINFSKNIAYIQKDYLLDEYILNKYIRTLLNL